MAGNREDWAIVVGVQVYPNPSFGELLAPENDARAFHEWLVSKSGGNLPKRNAKLILSSNYKQPFKDARNAKPTAERIADEFKKLDDIADENARKGLGRRVGRRLYLYFAGHGCAPSSPASGLALLLTANVTDIALGENIPGKMYADWYVWSAYFEEVVLFMDCCRDILAAAPINVPVNKLIIRQDAIDKGKVFYGYATKWSRVAREKPFNGTWQGVFTTALLAGLKGAASDPKDGRITAASLKNYLYNTWREFLSPQDLADPEIAKEPEVWWDPPNPTTGEDFVFATVPVIPTFPVIVNFPEELQGRKIEVIDSDFQVVAGTVIESNAWQVELKRGRYMLNLQAGEIHTFDVLGTGAVDVNF